MENNEETSKKQSTVKTREPSRSKSNSVEKESPGLPETALTSSREKPIDTNQLKDAKRKGAREIQKKKKKLAALTLKRREKRKARKDQRGQLGGGKSNPVIIQLGASSLRPVISKLKMTVQVNGNPPRHDQPMETADCTLQEDEGIGSQRLQATPPAGDRLSNGDELNETPTVNNTCQSPSRDNVVAMQSGSQRPQEIAPTDNARMLNGDEENEPSTSTNAHQSPSRGSIVAMQPGTGFTDTQLAFLDSATENDKQVVITSNRSRGRITSQEAVKIREDIVRQMMEAMSSPQGPELKFRSSGLLESGWFVVTAQDKASMDWLLNQWRPIQEEEVSFRALRADEIPKLEKIGFWLNPQGQVNVENVRRILVMQNRCLNIQHWQYVGMKPAPVGVFIMFLVSPETIPLLREQGWELFYELLTLSVRWVSARGTGLSSARGGYGYIWN